MPRARRVPQELAQWREAARQALADLEVARASPLQTKQGKRRIKEFERELRRKDKTFAEAAVVQVLVLEKEVEWRKSHRITIRQELDSLIFHFGEKAVHQIAKADLLAYRAELRKVTARGKETKLSAARINKMLSPLGKILREAADRFNFSTPYPH